MAAADSGPRARSTDSPRIHTSMLRDVTNSWLVAILGAQVVFVGEGEDGVAGACGEAIMPVVQVRTGGAS